MERNFNQEFSQLQEAAANDTVLFLIGRKILWMEYFGSSNPETENLARFQILAEEETRARVVPILRQLGVQDNATELVMELAEDKAREMIEKYVS